MSLKSNVTSAVLFVIAATAHAQDAKKEIKVDLVDMKVEQQFTPQITAVNVVDKRWTPKVWLEAQLNFKSTIATALGGRLGTLPAIEVKYFIGLSGVKPREGKPVILTGSITYKDVPSGDVHALAYVTPASLKRLLQKDNGGKGDVSAWAVEISVGGTVVGGKSSGGKWWEPAEKFSYEEVIISKDKTPFAPFWGDFDLATSSK